MSIMSGLCFVAALWPLRWEAHCVPVWTLLMVLVSFFPQGPSVLPSLHLLLNILIATLTLYCFSQPNFCTVSPDLSLVFIDGDVESCFSLTDEHILYILFIKLDSLGLSFMSDMSCLEKQPQVIQGSYCSTIPV